VSRATGSPKNKMAATQTGIHIVDNLEMKFQVQNYDFRGRVIHWCYSQ
jgi:hypothetical protein